MKLLVSIVLFLTAGILVITLFPFAVVFALVRGIYKRRPKDWYHSTQSYFYEMAFALDRFGNVLIAPLFNTIMIKEGIQKLLFGNVDETISSCLGRNSWEDNLSWLGRLLLAFLDLLDKDHCYKAATAFYTKYG